MSRKTPIKWETPSDCVKRSFRREVDAARKATKANDMRGRYEHYLCDDCKMWHIGHSLKDGDATGSST